MKAEIIAEWRHMETIECLELLGSGEWQLTAAGESTRLSMAGVLRWFNERYHCETGTFSTTGDGVRDILNAVAEAIEGPSFPPAEDETAGGDTTKSTRRRTTKTKVRILKFPEEKRLISVPGSAFACILRGKAGHYRPARLVLLDLNPVLQFYPGVLIN